MTDDTKARLAELQQRAEAATSTLVRPTDAELGQARAWAERVGHRWTWDAARRMSHEDATTVARVLKWLLTERAALQQLHHALEAGECCQAGERPGQRDYTPRVVAALHAIETLDPRDPQLSLLGKEPG